MLNVAENFVIDKSKDSALTYLWQAKSLMTNTTDVLVKKDVYHSLSRAFYYFDFKIQIIANTLIILMSMIQLYSIPKERYNL